jgi:hypothetical protein
VVPFASARTKSHQIGLAQSGRRPHGATSMPEVSTPEVSTPEVGGRVVSLSVGRERIAERRAAQQIRETLSAAEALVVADE